MNSRSTSPCQRRGHLVGERDVPAHARRRRAARRRAARATARRVAHSLAPQPLGSASGCEPNGSIRCSSAPGPSAATAPPPTPPRRRRSRPPAARRAQRRAARARPRASASSAAGSAPSPSASARRRTSSRMRAGVRLRSAWGRIATDPRASTPVALIAIDGRRAAQTAETCSSSATRNEEPQPQAATTLGLLTLKPAPCRLSS